MADSNAPMDQIQTLTEKIASAIAGVAPDDLTELAEIHEALGEAARWVDAHHPNKPAHQQIKSDSINAQSLLEKIMLHEAEDEVQTLGEVAKLVVDLQKMAAGEIVAPAAAVEKVKTPIAKPRPAAKPIQPIELSAETAVAADDVALANEFISEANGHLESAEAALLVTEESPDDFEAINSVFRSFHTIKGVAGFLNLKQIGALAHASENLLDLARHGHLQLAGPVADVILEALDLMKVLIASLGEAVAANQPAPVNPRLPSLLLRLGAAARKESPSAQSAAKSAASHPQMHLADTQKLVAAFKNNTDSTVKISTERLDSLINAVGELVIAQSMVSMDIASAARTNPKLGKNLTHMGKITRELQDLSMSMRMVPIHGVFQKMARLVRDLAKKSGKEVEFVTEGGETELDRNLVEAISDPLVHMVRNAADHGVELPEVRVKAGKSRAGRIELKAFHQGGNIAIQISDDGNGLPRARIIKKAVEAGIIEAGTELSEQDIFKLIFSPGLSTADSVTDVSGRGVGMDVVKKNVESLRGRIDIASTEGKGSTFTIRLPLTLAVIDGLIIKVGTHRYIIPITSVEQTVQPKPDQLSTVQNRGEMCMIRGMMLPLYRLDKVFGLQARDKDVTKALILILQDNERRCCLAVDELVGQQQVVIKTIGDTLGKIGGISGAAILGDGSACLILDVPTLMDLAVAGHKGIAQDRKEQT